MRFRNPFILSLEGDRDRLVRLFALFISFGYIVFFFLLYPRIESESSVLADWWMPWGLVTLYLPPLIMGVAAFVAELSILEWIAGLVAIGYFFAAFTWPLAWNGEALQTWPMVSGIPGLAAMAAALVWRPSWVALYTVAVVAEVQVLGQTRSQDVIEPLWMSLLFALSFCLVYAAAALRAVHTGYLLDAAREEAARLSAEAEVVLEYNAEREHFADIVHDNVMHCLQIGASGRSSRADVAEAIRALELIGTEAGSEPSLLGAEAIGRLRRKLQAVDARMPLIVDSALGPADGEFDAAVVHVAALVLGEAVRNSIRHAGPDADRTATVRIEPHRLSVRVDDNGCGFDPSTDSRRWGLYRLRQQVERIANAELRIKSSKGHGTTIEMRWSASE
ncbi:ATP-binding protein [Nocardia sp. NPDC050712]|uniref:sensor histidine kinase n=1 Tax=Nocardia sp. NPDC050712 TaxID=3155518 RepID=UPI0033F54CB5